MRILINGEQREFPQAVLRLNELIEQLSLPPQRIAVEVNQTIVPRADWEKTMIHDGDRIEVVHFVGGGTAGGSWQTAKGRGRQARFYFPITRCTVNAVGDKEEVSNHVHTSRSTN